MRVAEDNLKTFFVNYFIRVWRIEFFWNIQLKMIIMFQKRTYIKYCVDSVLRINWYVDRNKLEDGANFIH